MSIASILFGKGKNADETVFLRNRAPIRSVPMHLQPIMERNFMGNHIWLEAGSGKPIIFCHGLFGGIFNVDTVCREIAMDYRFMMPYLPMYDMPLMQCTTKKLGEYLESFINDLQLDEAVLIGNSMGGSTALHYGINPSNRLKGMVLCGSSGLSNIPLSKGYFRRKEYSFVKESIRDIFYDRTVPGEEMTRDVFNAIQSNETVLRSIRFTKSATKHTLENELSKVQTPSLLVWGREDPITPVEVAPRFQQLMPDARLRIINECGHVPQQEKPYQFLEHFYDFMKTLNY